MAKNNIIIKATEFQYPTREELQKINLETPKLKTFSFQPVNELLELMSNTGNMEDVAKRSHLHWWNHCLINRMGSLIHAYDNSLVHYYRGVPDDLKDYQHQHYVNRTQFSFYSETYFYFFISVRDTIAQLINTYYQLGFKENRVHLNEAFLNKIQDLIVKGIIEQFILDTAVTTDFRNSLAHRFLLTHADYRPTITYKNGNPTFSIGAGTAIKSSELYNEIKGSLKYLSVFLQNLEQIIR